MDHDTGNVTVRMPVKTQKNWSKLLRELIGLETG